MEKLASRKLRINAKETMRIAEKLYTAGYISYPRTETNIFPKEMDLRPLVEMQVRLIFNSIQELTLLVDFNWNARQEIDLGADSLNEF